ncbi:MAG: type II secretion system protein [Vampirovibrionia bacterium]
MIDSKQKGFTLLELLIVVVILGVLALISTAFIINAADKAKNSAVRANIAAAASTITHKITIDPIPHDELIEYTLTHLNNPDGIDDSGDEIMSPYNNKVVAFVTGGSAEAGQVTINSTGDIIIRIIGYGIAGSNAEPIMSKTVSTVQEE